MKETAFSARTWDDWRRARLSPTWVVNRAAIAAAVIAMALTSQASVTVGLKPAGETAEQQFQHARMEAERSQAEKLRVGRLRYRGEAGPAAIRPPGDERRTRQAAGRGSPLCGGRLGSARGASFLDQGQHDQVGFGCSRARGHGRPRHLASEEASSQERRALSQLAAASPEPAGRAHGGALSPETGTSLG